MQLPKIFYSKGFLIACIIAFLLTAVLEYKQWQARRSIDAEILALKQEEQRLYESNQELQESINFLSSPEYQDKLARLQLNLKKEGELVVSFPPENQDQVGEGENKPKSNILQWWQYIFVN